MHTSVSSYVYVYVAPLRSGKVMRTSTPDASTSPSSSRSFSRIVTFCAARSHSRTLLEKRSTTGCSLSTCEAPAAGTVLCSTTVAADRCCVVKSLEMLCSVQRPSSLQIMPAGMVTV